MKLCIDIDYLLYEAASVAEETYIKALHRPTGVVYEFENKTELWGRKKAKNEGWIGGQNLLLGDYYKAEDFEVTKHQRPRNLTFDGVSVPPLEGGKRILDSKIKELCDKLGCYDYYGYTGEGETFRHKAATLLPYKGNRKDSLTPLILDDLKQYAIDKHNIILVKDIEADDGCSMDVYQGYEKWKKSKSDKDITIGVAEDKDSKGVQGFWFNPNKDKSVRKIAGFGKLFLNENEDVDGHGRMWLYYQICYGDKADGYSANCHSEKRWGELSAYKALTECKNDKEAWEALVKTFKHLYPEPKEIVNFIGDKIVIDWLYVLQEMATLAHMKRNLTDRINVRDVLNKLEINYE